jgi:hypothetical protein
MRAIFATLALLVLTAALLPAAEDQLWQELMQDDEAGAKRAFVLARNLQKSPRYTVDFLRARLKPQPLVVPERTGRLIRELDSDNFATREEAYKALLELGMAAQPALIQELAKKPSLEVTNRINQILGKLDAPLSREIVRVMRCAEILDLVGTPEARALLKEMATGSSVPLGAEDQQYLLELADKK